MCTQRMQSWTIETWSLVLAPAGLCAITLVTVLGKVISDIERIELLKVQIHALRVKHASRVRAMAEQRGMGDDAVEGQPGDFDVLD